MARVVLRGTFGRRASVLAATLVLAAIPVTSTSARAAEPAADSRVSALTVLPLGNLVLLKWTGIVGSDRYLVKTENSTTTLGAGATSHLLSLDNGGSLFSLTGVTVEPHVIVVSAVAGNTLLHTFVGRTACPNRVFIAARGSGQNDLAGRAYGRGLGDRGLRVWEGMRQASGATATDLPAIAIDYPAVKVGLTGAAPEPGNLPEVYTRSVDTGVARTKITILKTLIACPRSKLILFGYSQGAQVIGNAFSQLPPSVRRSVSRVILFADPLYRPSDKRAVYLPKALSDHGIKGSRSTFPSGDDAVIESWCWERDMICQGPPRFAFHGDIYDEYERLAVRRATS